MKKLRKHISVILSIVIVISAVSTAPLGVSANSPPANASLEEYVVWHLENYASSIDLMPYLSSFNPSSIRNENEGNAFARKVAGIISDIIMDNPQLFHVSTIGTVTATEISWFSDSGQISSLNAAQFTYIIPRSQYPANRQSFDRAVENALEYIKNADNDFEKVLFLHDYLVLTTAYDKDNLDHYLATGNVLNQLSHTAFGALVSGKAVCDGYAKAYLHLLKRAGITSVFVVGDLKSGNQTVPHTWNLVRLGGNWFHVDVTANDPLLENRVDMLGYVSHKFFLLSDNALSNHGTHTWSSTQRATSNSYDNAFFRAAETAIIRIGNFYYWLSSTPLTAISNRGTNNNNIRRYSISSRITETVHSFESIWYLDGTENNASSFSFDINSYARLAAYDDKLYFNTAKDIRSYEPATGQTSIIAQPAGLGGTGNRFIYGMIMNGRTITYTVKTNAINTDSFVSIDVPVAAPPPPPPVPTPPSGAYIKGDVNGDGKVNTFDALEVLKFAVGLENVIEGNPQALAAALVVSTGTPKMADALAIIKMAVGLEI
jgi:hypothetical protein